jgi:hypothetical protein
MAKEKKTTKEKKESFDKLVRVFLSPKQDDMKEITPENLELIGFEKTSSVGGECYERGTDVVCFGLNGEVTSPQGQEEFNFGKLAKEILKKKGVL